MAKRGRLDGEGPVGVPQAPGGPRRPATPSAASSRRPSTGAARPVCPVSSLVLKTKESTQDYPDLRLRIDDTGRGFLFVPMFGSSYFKVPDPCTGPRSTVRLTPRAVRNIKGAAIKAVKVGEPLRTFVTFTVRAESRPAFAEGSLVLGREMKRTLNAFNEWLRRRGDRGLVYIWVAENKGEANPHVHMLLNYRVARKDFETFAAHIEALWGHGFAHIERVREPQRAGRYILKALGYTMKGAEDGQGTVIGNRFGISRKILPKYETVNLFESAEAAEGLRVRQAAMTEDIQEIAPGLYLLRHGVSFNDDFRLEDVLEVLAGPST